MTKPRRITVRGIIYNEGKLLCQRLRPGSDGEKRTYWCTPGGGLEAGESLHEGLHREMIEETNIVPKIGKLLFIQQYHDNEKEFLEFFFHIENPEDFHTIDLASASHGLLEVEHVEYVSPSEKNILPLFLQSIDIEKSIKLSQEVLVMNNFRK
jgi:ADP-ribose pyrophosphatase YjhB (NUDIX family)